MHKKAKSHRFLRVFAAAGAALVSTSIVLADAQDAIAAASGSDCTAAQPFYWEIGQSSGSPLVSGQSGGTTYNRNTTVTLASASKWVFGAYVVERYNGIPTGSSGATIVSSLKMLEGHTSFGPVKCAFTSTVSACHTIGTNDNVDSSKVGYFNYGGGDGQYAAAGSSLLNLGSKTKSQLLSEVNSYLNLGSSFAYKNPGVSGGMEGNAADYATFLQNLMDGTYVMSSHLGASAVSTQCTQCNSPFGSADMHYSLHHWVEDNTGGQLPGGASLSAGDGSFSSAGAKGFYPWISSDKQYYGIISTEGDSESSYICGKAIREAYFN